MPPDATPGEDMTLRRRRRNRNKKRRSPDVEENDASTTNRLRSIGRLGGYSSPDERDDVETRIRNMWFGAKRADSRVESDDGD